MTLVCENCLVVKALSEDSKIKMGFIANKLSGPCDLCKKPSLNLRHYKKLKK